VTRRDHHQPKAPLTLVAASLVAAETRPHEEAVLGAISAASGADLLLLPELAPHSWLVTAAPPAIADTALTLDAPLIARVRAAALRKRLAVALPFALAHAGAVFNAVVAIDEDGEIIPARDASGQRWPFSAKLHLPPVRQGFGERDHFSPGPGPMIHAWRGLGLGVLVCFDRRFPECWRALARLGCDITLVPVGGPGGDAPGQFEAELRTHAKANGVAAVAACRSGQEMVRGETIVHEGQSCIIGPEGDVRALDEGGDATLRLTCATIIPTEIAAARQRRPFLALLRDDVAALAHGLPPRHGEASRSRAAVPPLPSAQNRSSAS
jgi:N-carbamoylputrescine amidase